MTSKLTVEVYGCGSCPFRPDRVYEKRGCRLDDEVIVRHRNRRPGRPPPKDCPLRLGSVRHVLCEPDGKEVAP